MAGGGRWLFDRMQGLILITKITSQEHNTRQSGETFRESGLKLTQLFSI
jgi:hypothetical protein